MTEFVLNRSLRGKSFTQYRCRSIRFPAATAQISCGELAQGALLADRLLLEGIILIYTIACTSTYYIKSPAPSDAGDLA